MKLILSILASLIFRVAFVGDPQVNSQDEVRYARNSILKELSCRKDLDIVIFLGDIVNNKPDLMGEMRNSFDSLPCPWFSVRGNHDKPEPYINNFGPLDTLFEAGGATFLLLDNASGHLQTHQLQLIDSIFSTVSPEQTLVIASHIPMSNIPEYKFPNRKNTLYVAAHTHTVERKSLGECGEALVAGASCGSWWRGPVGDDGIPCATQRCGSPRNYFVMNIEEGGRYNLEYKEVGGISQCEVHSDSTSVFVNVYGGHYDGRVTIRAAGSCRRIVLSRCDTIAPNILKILEHNSTLTKEKRTRSNPDYIPMLRRNSSHIWRGSAIKARRCRYIVTYNDPFMSFRQKVTENIVITK